MSGRGKTVILFLLLGTLLTACGKMEAADDHAGGERAGFHKAAGYISSHTEADSKAAFINCANVYQTESGVNSTGWNATFKHYIKEQMIKYHIDGIEKELTEINLDSLIRFIRILSFYKTRMIC